ncbi:MAG TPA: NUDIX domain-containing protein [Candidatus Pacearchaeota archaeon]|nr:NUDIX domain-containing protein [Candidatus Pacearchaeota archaeon]
MKKIKNNLKKRKYRKAVFGVVYSKDPLGKIEYLILKRKKHWKGWEFPKGKIENKETKRIAVRREVHEETGLKITSIKSFNEKGKYIYKKILADRPKIIGQTYSLFGVQVKKGKVKIDKIEHNGHRWVSFEEAYKKLTWPNQRKCLKMINNWIKDKSKNK